MESVAPAGLKASFEVQRLSIRRLLTARLGNANDAEDLTQELWIKLDHIAPGPIANPSAYLHRMALNAANDLVRERVRRRGREAAWSDMTIADSGGIAVDPEPSAERTVIARSELDRLNAAIRALPQKAGLVFRRHRIDGESHADIAANLGISKSAVEKHMATAMKHLATAMILGDDT